MEEGRIILQNIQGAEAEARPASAMPYGSPSGAGPDNGSAEKQTGHLLAEASASEETGRELAEEASVEEEGREALLAGLEAILFAMGDSVPIGSLAAALGTGEKEVQEAALQLAEKYSSAESGLVLNRYGDSLQLSTKPQLYDVLIRIAAEPKKPKLTPTLMETLSIIAFRQPVTRMEVEQIRGVNSDFAISRLVSFDLVQEVGRREVPGRPLLFGTTEQFLRSFGIRSVEDLPEPDLSLMEEFREEAEEEVTSKLDV